jgi:Leucine-rich repeat (LRR) protein
MEFGKLQSLVEFDLSGCFKLRCLPDSIVNLSQLKTFRLSDCDKLENLPMEFGKFQSLSQCNKLEVRPIILIFKAKVTYHYYVVIRQI